MPKDEKLDTKRHSLAHIMAASIQEMFPEARFGVGPVVEDGFYYDVADSRPLTPDDLGASDMNTRTRMNHGLSFEQTEISNDQHDSTLERTYQHLKAPLLADLKP